MIVVTIESPLGHVAPEMTTLEMIHPLLLQLKFMSFLGDPRNMAEIDKDQLKNFDISGTYRPYRSINVNGNI